MLIFVHCSKLLLLLLSFSSSHQIFLPAFLHPVIFCIKIMGHLINMTKFWCSLFNFEGSVYMKLNTWSFWNQYEGKQLYSVSHGIHISVSYVCFKILNQKQKQGPWNKVLFHRFKAWKWRLCLYLIFVKWQLVWKRWINNKSIVLLHIPRLIKT